ncbi:DUF421 domain-containing protein [Halobacillus seohaensis]|uniref:DUF421 domain-containing protein n=1 Tax=Halobacillus seohaensis TaxID=447421 RepID=A0ABW2EDG9_9BACI
MVSRFLLTPITIFIVGYLLLRIVGGKSVSKMNSFDLLFVLIVGIILTEPLVSKDTFLSFYFSLIFVLLYVIISRTLIKRKFSWMLNNPPIPLVRDGDILEDGLQEVSMTTEELLAELRLKGYTHSEDIQLAMMESVGRISVIPKAYRRPLQARDIQLEPIPEFIPIPLILNGQLLSSNLDYLHKDDKWLDMQLKASNYSLENISDITLATLNSDGTVRVDAETNS